MTDGAFVLPDGAELPSEEEARFLDAVAGDDSWPVWRAAEVNADGASEGSERRTYVEWVYVTACAREEHMAAARSDPTPIRRHLRLVDDAKDIQADTYAALPGDVADHNPGLLGALWRHSGMIEHLKRYQLLKGFLWEVAGITNEELVTESSGERTLRKG